MEKFSENPEYRKLIAYAMRALARRAHTEHELRQKLSRRLEKMQINSAPTDSLAPLPLEDAVIARLKELNFINDEAYIHDAISSASTWRMQGRVKIAAKLQRKGISFSKTEEVWKSMDLNEKEIAMKALEKAKKRFQNLPSSEHFQKKAYFLASRGFSPEIVFELASKKEIE